MLLFKKYFTTNDSKQAVWVTPDVESVYDPVYVDLFVRDPKVVCIDQHIVAHNKRHALYLRGLGTKINPNLERGRTFAGDYDSDYFHKYPFGTFHYLVALLGCEGIDVRLPDFDKAINVPELQCSSTVGHVIMRADDALLTSLSAYPVNAANWWRYLLDTSDCVALRQMVDFVKSCDRSMAGEYESKIGSFFKALGCDGVDGAFDDIIDHDQSKLSDSGLLVIRGEVERLYSIVKSMLGVESVHPFPREFVLHEGEIRKASLRSWKRIDYHTNREIFSYAYIRGPYSEPNFSYTVKLD